MQGVVGPGGNRSGVRVVKPAMLTGRSRWLIVTVILASACGASTEPIGGPPETFTTNTTPVASTGAPGRPEASTPATTSVFDQSPPAEGPSSRVPDGRPAPDDVHWLAPAIAPSGLRLVEARRDLAAGCGELEDCLLEVPAAELVYDTDDLAVHRSARITQTLPETGDAQAEQLGGVAGRVGDREVIWRDYGPGDTGVDLQWTEPTGIVVFISSLGLSTEDLEAVAESLRPIAPNAWPGADVVEPLEPCVDDTTRFAPTVLPDGWVRYVLDAHPDGSCRVDTFLWMSFVEPGTADGPGTLVNIVVTPASTSIDESGEAILVGDHPALLHTSEQPDGTVDSSIDMKLGAATINAHGSVSPETLVEIMSSVELLDAAEWSVLVGEIVADQ